AMGFGDDIAPQLRGLEDVRLVHRAHAPVPLAGRLEGRAGDPADLPFRVAHRVEALAFARFGAAYAARLAEVDVAGQLPHDEDVESRHQLRPQRGGMGQFRIDQRRTQVGEEVEVLAQA